MGRYSCTQNSVLYNVLISHLYNLYINYQAKTSIHAGCKLQVLDSAPFCWPTAIIQWLTATCEGFQASTINNQVCELWVMGHPFHILSRLPGKSMTHSWTFLGTRCKQQTTPTPEAGCDVCSQAIWPTALLKLNSHHPRSPHELSIWFYQNILSSNSSFPPFPTPKIS